MDTYMEMDSNQQTEENEQMVIKLKECPRCRTPIRKNIRYGCHVNRSRAAIEMVKEKMNGQRADIARQREALKIQLSMNKDLYKNLRMEVNYVKVRLEAPHLIVHDLVVVENMIGFMERAEKLLKVQREAMTVEQSARFGVKVERFLRWLVNPQQKFSEQQVSDLQDELERLVHLAELNGRCKVAEDRGQMDKIQAEADAIRQVLERIGPLTEEDQVGVKQALKDLDDRLPYTGLGISDEERQMIVSAVNMKPGHWYKCPNGHVYLITECGGAMVSRRCPDCDATIGGGNHALASGNQVASEMDGARHAAWSEAFNLLNFDQNNLW